MEFRLYWIPFAPTEFQSNKSNLFSEYLSYEWKITGRGEIQRISVVRIFNWHLSRTNEVLPCTRTHKSDHLNKYISKISRFLRSSEIVVNRRQKSFSTNFEEWISTVKMEYSNGAIRFFFIVKKKKKKWLTMKLAWYILCKTRNYACIFSCESQQNILRRYVIKPSLHETIERTYIAPKNGAWWSKLLLINKGQGNKLSN